MVQWSSGLRDGGPVVQRCSGPGAGDAHAFRFIRFQEQTYWPGDGGDGGPVVIWPWGPPPPPFRQSEGEVVVR